MCGLTVRVLTVCSVFRSVTVCSILLNTSRCGYSVTVLIVACSGVYACGRAYAIYCDSMTNTLTYERIRAQYRRNLAGLQSLLTKAEQSGRKVNGYTVDQLRDSVRDYERLSTASDDALRQHFVTLKGNR